MSLTINAGGITGEATRHIAAPLHHTQPEDSPWRVSWLPDRGYSLSRQEAITAIWVAETVAEMTLGETDGWPPQLGMWADERGSSP